MGIVRVSIQRNMINASDEDCEKGMLKKSLKIYRTREDEQKRAAGGI